MNESLTYDAVETGPSARSGPELHRRIIVCSACQQSIFHALNTLPECSHSLSCASVSDPDPTLFIGSHNIIIFGHPHLKFQCYPSIIGELVRISTTVLGLWQRLGSEKNVARARPCVKVRISLQSALLQSSDYCTFCRSITVFHLV